jgi:hypothetical protein
MEDIHFNGLGLEEHMLLGIITVVLIIKFLEDQLELLNQLRLLEEIIVIQTSKSANISILTDCIGV